MRSRQIALSGLASAAAALVAVPPTQPSPSTGNAVRSGGQIAWSTGYTFIVSACAYTIAGVNYTAPQTSLTLSAADGSNPRIDVIVANTSGAITVVAGTAAAEPIKPFVDPVSQVELSFILVNSGTTQPDSLVTNNVYVDGSGEWTGSKSGAGVTLASTSSPITGTASVLLSTMAVGDYIQWISPAGALDLTTYDSLVFDLKPSSASSFGSGFALSIEWRNNNSVRGSRVSVRHGQYGFDRASTATQKIVIPLRDFGAAGILVDRFRIIGAGSGTCGARIDNVGLQGGIRSTLDVAEPVEFQLNLSDLTTALTTGTGKAYFRAPFAFTLTGVSVSLLVASSSGLPTVDINVNAATILSTKLSIDDNEKTSNTAATPPVLTKTAIAKDDEFTFDIDVAGTGAKGLIVTLLGTRP